MDDDMPRLMRGEIPVPGFVGLDADGHFVHYCHCGKFGAHGYGYFPRKGRLGVWYCNEHRPAHGKT